MVNRTPSSVLFDVNGNPVFLGAGGAAAVVTKRFEITAAIIYIGSAPLESLESSSIWTVKRTLLDSEGAATETKVALLSAWDDRATLTYT